MPASPKSKKKTSSSETAKTSKTTKASSAKSMSRICLFPKKTDISQRDIPEIKGRSVPAALYRDIAQAARIRGRLEERFRGIPGFRAHIEFDQSSARSGPRHIVKISCPPEGGYGEQGISPLHNAVIEGVTIKCYRKNQHIRPAKQDKKIGRKLTDSELEKQLKRPLRWHRMHVQNVQNVKVAKEAERKKKIVRQMVRHLEKHKIGY